MSKVPDKAAALAAFHRSPRPTADSLKQWDTIDGDIGVGHQQVVRSIFASIIHAVQNVVPAKIAMGFALHRSRNVVTGAEIRTRSSAKADARAVQIPHLCR